ncbi:MAG: hypothetical protein KC620_23895, partial [Myxococcales bacterium]|nr:hypothetical protein [Myxococcales bacterium]
MAPVDPVVFCQMYSACGFDDLLPCDLFVNDFGAQPGVLECAFALLDPCPEDPIFVLQQCLDGGGPDQRPICEAHCAGEAACGELPGTLRDCVGGCLDVLEGQQGDDASRLLGLDLGCARRLDCADRAACLAVARPENACALHCGLLEGCGLAAPDCAADCEDNFFRARTGAWRTCVQAAEGDCPAMANCAPPPPLPCTAECARRSVCGDRDPNCRATCEDLSFTDPSTAARRFACVLSAPLCNANVRNTPQGCVGDPQSGGGACLGYCRATVGCDAPLDALGDCLVRCGEGFVGDDAARFVRASPCLEALDPQAACAPLERCVTALPEPDCGGWCGPLAACGLAPDACDASCPDDDLARHGAWTQVDCLAAADGDCDEAGLCLQPAEDAPPVVDPVVFCQRYTACGFDNFLPCRDLVFDIAGGDPAFVACAFPLMDPCPPDPFLVLDQCLRGGLALPAEYAGCARLCTVEALCGLLPDNARDCAETCVQSRQRNANSPFAPLLPCGDLLTCAEVSACVADNGPGGQCADACAAAVACGAWPDADACLQRCTAQLLSPNVPFDYIAATEACLAELADDAPRCAAEGAACFDFAVGDCEAACAAALGCGALEPGGEIECVDGCRQDPDAGPVINCLLQNFQPPDFCDFDG